jgi:tetratricopeptide (TPR) repeat protein
MVEPASAPSPRPLSELAADTLSLLRSVDRMRPTAALLELRRLNDRLVWRIDQSTRSSDLSQALNLRAQVLGALGWLAFYDLDRPAFARQCLREGMDLASGLEDDGLLAYFLVRTGAMNVERRQYAPAGMLLTQALDVVPRQDRYSFLSAWAWCRSAELHARQFDDYRAHECMENAKRAFSMAERAPQPHMCWLTSEHIAGYEGFVLSHTGQPAKAVEIIEPALRTRDPEQLHYQDMLIDVAEAEVIAGDYDGAVNTAREALLLAQQKRGTRRVRRLAEVVDLIRFNGPDNRDVVDLSREMQLLTRGMN